MRVLLLGATGNLGSRLVPELLVHGHEVVAFVRSTTKLCGLISPTLFEQIYVYEGDALLTEVVEDALRSHNCDAIVNTAGTRMPSGQEQILGKIAASVSSATIRVSKARGSKPFRAWFIGGLGSLEYPGTGGHKIQDYLPLAVTQHHRETEQVLTAVPVNDLEWTLLCVAFMKPKTEVIDVLQTSQRHGLELAFGRPPAWEDSWVEWLPIVDINLKLIPAIMTYTTMLEDVADLIAGDLASTQPSPCVGKLVGMKNVSGKQET